MSFLGIDIGSRYIKAVLIEKGTVIDWFKIETSYEPLKRSLEILKKYSPIKAVATGYGRHLLSFNGNIPTITEIKAFAIGARALMPSCRTIIDIGGQDTKIISLDERGNIKKFEMNDKCSAGTGRFLEIMASALAYSIDEFGKIEGEIESPLQISSMCTVFAESEVISLISKGISREEIAIAIHRAIAKRVISMLKKISLEEDIVFAGGCAGNRLLKKLIEIDIGKRILIHEKHHFAGALGAAIYAEKSLIEEGGEKENEKVYC
ncbi:acyl-CoA dehydratase activase [Thermodesulfovibrio yellowstonii]|uniref:Activator of (R)-2-hydroxyglutaryl-CoA dehydratase n=1 Tax=Thermodesulfovibrio yellowstonii (strain ATCC 51303 / DSM 11347 / YP87) TaxID=289376 RepID=B5YL50_THEYD|nr:acyl-CoA dehydratase activase [Thermodesulfovibrio yellowstonii]ACI21677.1 activator of (R)-2-hydroxyglutaryl-CoA dehydratase [Thermodesulfovibrio yellowstonii DSM 11347]MDI6864097.1 acyl-CoA dehydratase activase [Thermodesulfovibrio yellowstonii]